MRTKALLCAAALAAGAATSMAQNVYSLNVVGYINLTLQPGFNLVANQLDADGYFTNNYVTNVFSTNLPSGSAIYAFNAASGLYSTITWNGKKWFGSLAPVNTALAPGQGVFVSLAGSSPVTITTVGQVNQGTYSVPLVPGLQIVSSIAPIAGDLITNLNYVPTANDAAYLYNATTQLYSTRTFNGKKWFGGGSPYLNVSDAIFLQSATATNWTQVFTVQ
jgi:hypothetical protein